MLTSKTKELELAGKVKTNQRVKSQKSKKFGSGTCVHEHISPLLGEHPHIVNIFLGPVTVHYTEVSLYIRKGGQYF